MEGKPEAIPLLGETMPRIQDAVELSMPRTQDAVEFTMPMTQDAVELTMPRTQDAVDITMPKTEDALGETMPMTQEAVDITMPRTEDALDITMPRTEDALDITTPRTEDAIELMMLRTQDAVDITTPRTQDAVDRTMPRTEDEQHTAVKFDIPSSCSNPKRKQTTRKFPFSRLDSIIDKYARAGGTANNRKYTLPLLQVTEDGDHKKCKRLIEEGEDIGLKDEETSYSALHIAAKSGSYDIIKLLLSKGADCNIQDNTGQTPLHLAVKKDHIYCCQIFLSCSDLKINLQSKAHDTPLHYAAKEGRYEICKMLLGHRDAKVNAKNKKGMMPLHYAAQENQTEIFKLLLENNADWRKTDNDSYLALHYAAQKGFRDCCQIMFSNLSDEEKEKLMKTCLKDGKTPLMVAAKGGHHQCCEIMEFRNLKAKDKEGNTALHYAALGGFDCTVRDLLEAGADPNTQNKKGSAPVLEAAGKKKFSCLEILAKNGANTDVFDKQDKSVLHYAAERNALETLKFLLDSPALIASLDKKDAHGYSALHLAIRNKADESALLLLERGASLMEPCGGRLTPLHLAAARGSTRICEFLLSKKEVQVSQENDLKATPLHLAAFRGSVDVCQMLVRKAARITAVDNKGRTALHVASAEGHTNVVKFLSKKGIPVKLRDDTDSCALHLAASIGSLECCQVIVNAAKATCWEFDQNRDLPLDKAFKKKAGLTPKALENHDQVFKFLLMNLCFKGNQDMQKRIHEYMHIALKDGRVTVMEAIVDSCWWEYGISGENGHQCMNFRDLIKTYPNVALKFQNRCIERSKENGSKVTYDFKMLEDNYFVRSSVDSMAKSPFDPETHRVVPNAKPYTEDGLKWKQNHPLTLMISHHRHQLLNHPLVKIWLWNKWKSYIQIIFLIRLLIEVLFAISISLFMGCTDNWLHVKRCCDRSGNSSAMGMICGLTETLSTPKDLKGNSENLTRMDDVSLTSDLNKDTPSCFACFKEGVVRKLAFWSCLLILTIVIILLEVNYICRLKKQYIKKFVHWLQLLRIITTLVVLVPFSACDFQYHILEVWQWQFGIIAFLVTWLHLINTLNQLPKISVFMPVTWSFAKNFLTVIFYIGMIIYVFAFIFHLLLIDQAAFSSVHQAMVKTIVWMLGDLGYDDTFLANKQELHYPIMVNLLFVAFVTILGGFIANMVIAQPAKEIDNFRDKALFRRDASRAELFLMLDIYFPFYLKKRTVGSYVDDESKMDDYSLFSKKFLMLDTKEEFKPEEANPLEVKLEELNKQFLEQKDRDRDIKLQLNFLIKSLEQK